MFSLKKRFLLVVLFGVFFIILLFVSIAAKNGSLPKIIVSPTPTMVPVETQRNGGTTTTAKIDSSPATLDNNLGDIAFTYTTKDIPSSSTIYTQAPTSIPADTMSKLQEKLIAGGSERIINTPKGQVLFMQKESKTLTIYVYSRTLVYSDSNPQPSQTSDPAVVANGFIKSLSLPLDTTKPKIAYFSNKTSDLSEVKSASEADTIDVSYKEKVNNLPVYRQYGSDAIAHVWLAKDGKITKFTYVFAPQYEPQKSILLPTLSKAEEMIRSKKGIIVSLGNDYQQRETKNISSTVLTSVEVGYFSDFEGGTLVPMFIFKGTSVVGGTKTPITVYLPVS